MRRAALSVALALGTAGCVATQKDILDLSQQNDTMALQVQSMKKVMGQLQANQADLNARLEDLHKDMSVLNETLKDNRESTSRLSAKMDDLGAALGVKVSSLQHGIEQTQATLKEAEERRRLEAAEAARRSAAEAAAAKAQAEAQAKAEAEAKAKVQPDPKPSEVFQQARQQLEKKDYDTAASGFELYLEKFPKGETADLAAYNLGAARFAQERWEDSARAYARVLDGFPKSEVTAASRLRYAQCLVKLKSHLDEARRYLESIPHDFPKSPEAAKAREALQALAGKKKR